MSRGRQLLSYAALASIAVLLEQTVRVFRDDQGIAEFLPAGLLSMGYFATALITNRLAQRVITNERVARQRGIDLANQLRVNQLVIQTTRCTTGPWATATSGGFPSTSRRRDVADFAAIGIYGQFVYVNPAENVVIAKTSAYEDYNEDGDEMEFEAIEAFRAIARGL